MYKKYFNSMMTRLLNAEVDGDAYYTCEAITDILEDAYEQLFEVEEQLCELLLYSETVKNNSLAISETIEAIKRIKASVNAQAEQWEATAEAAQ